MIFGATKSGFFDDALKNGINFGDESSNAQFGMKLVVVDCEVVSANDDDSFTPISLRF